MFSSWIDPVLNIFDISFFAIPVDIVDTVKTFFIIIVISIRWAQQVPLGAIDTELAVFTVETIVLGHWRAIHSILLTGLVP